VAVARRPQTERRASAAWAPVASQQVVAPHHLGDAHGGVVDHDRQRVGPQAVAAAHDDVADLALDVEARGRAEATSSTTTPGSKRARHAGARPSARRARRARAERARSAVRRPARSGPCGAEAASCRSRRDSQSSARATGGGERGERLRVVRAALALAVGAVGTADVGALVPVEAEPAELVEVAVDGAGTVRGPSRSSTRSTKRAALRPRAGPGQQRGAGVAEVERAGGRGREAPADRALRGCPPGASPPARPSAMSVGVGAMTTPAASSAAILSAAVPWPPLMMAPAWPIRLPGGAVVPAMKPATGFVMCARIQAAASSSALPPISPIRMTASVAGSAWNSQHVDEVGAVDGSPPMPTPSSGRGRRR
jgi:hypothetical protein